MTTTSQVDGALDLRRTMAHLAHGPGDPTIRLERDRVWWATRTPDGPVAMVVSLTSGGIQAEAFGDGAHQALERLPGLLGLASAPVRIAEGNVVVDRLVRRFPGVRVTRTEAVIDSLIPAILEQKVIGIEASRAWRGLVRVHGEAAPGPVEWRLRLGPSAATLAALPYYAYHPFGIERRRAEVIRAVAARATWLEAIIDLPLPEAHARLMSVPGVGPWTAAEVAVRALGDQDAVSVGDFHLPHLVAFALAGEPRATDDRMLDLLEPYRGHRALVMRLLELGGPRPPRRGQRLPFQRIDDR